MDIKILGTGCPRCKALEQITRNAAAELDGGGGYPQLTPGDGALHGDEEG